MLKPEFCLLLAAAVTLRAADEGGTLGGKVVFGGALPIPAMKAVPAADQPGCKCKEVADESLVVDATTKGIKWAIIRILDVQASALPKDLPIASITQKGCTFTPHVVVVAPETDLVILNPEGIAHNIHTVAFDNEGHNFAVGAGQEKATYLGKWLKQPEVINLQCDIHPWMKGLIVNHDPRYCAVTGADGTFKIQNVPPGKYKVNLFQERLGEKEFDVVIKAGAHFDLGEIKLTAK